MISVRASSGFLVMIAAASMLALPQAAQAGPTAAQKCESGKNGAAGKYASCLHRAQSKFVKGGEVNTAGYNEAVLACGDKYGSKWQSLEDAAEGVCPSTGDASSIQDFLDACIFTAEDALGGGTLPSDVVTCNGDLTTCGGSLGSCTGSLGTCSGNLSTCNSDLSSTNADLTSCTGDLATANAGTAVVGDVLGGKTFASTAGLGATGTMPNNGAVTLTPTASDQAIAAGYHDGAGKCAGDADLVAGNIKDGVNLFGLAGTLSAGGLRKTGQTTCHGTGGSGIPCAGSGHDGELQKGLVRTFTDNGDGTVTDNLTGLMWEKQSDDGSIHDKDNIYTWDTTFASKVATLNSTVFAGHNDWRVPNVVELQSLVNYGAGNPSTFSAFNTSCSASCTVLTCSCTRVGDYASSSTYHNSPSLGWFVHFGDGFTYFDNKSDNFFLRAVRAGS